MNRTFWYLVVAWLLCACSTSPSVAPTIQIVVSTTNVSSSQTIVLPALRTQGTLTLEETLAKRRSVREYTNVPLTLEEIGQLLWAAQGVTSSAGQRTAPSAGGLYPLEIYVATSEGVYQYVPASHSMTAQIVGDKRQALYDASLQQSAVRDAPAVFIIAAVDARTSGKYGDRAERYVQLGAGHAAQNILLQAVALNLGGVTIGAFEDDKVQQAIALPQENKPLYVIPVGHPK